MSIQLLGKNLDLITLHLILCKDCKADEFHTFLLSVTASTTFKMPPPRDRMAAMQQQAYFGEEEDYNIPIDDEHPEGMQDFFHEIEQMRETAHQVKLEIDKTKQLQNDILGAPTMDPKQKQGLEDTMNV